MKNILAIDIGNTNISIGLFEGRRLAKKTKIPTNDHSRYVSALKRFLGNQRMGRVIISSVVPDVTVRITKILRRLVDWNILVLGDNANVPIKNLYRNKSEVGQDRLVNAFAAKTLYRAPAVVIDFGTAVTFDIVSISGEYLGGLIMPGIELSLSSLHEKTALLPKVTIKAAPHIIGKDTVSSIRGGILFGFGAMVDGLISKYKKILGVNTRIIATGGNASLVRRYAKSIQVIDNDLTLKGLYRIAA